MIIIKRPWTQQPYGGLRLANVNSDIGRGLVLLSTGFKAGSSPVNAAKRVPELSVVTAGTAEVGVFNGSVIHGIYGTTHVYAVPASELSALFSASGAASIFAIVRATASDSSGGSGPIFMRGTNGGLQEHYPYNDGNIYLGTFAQNRWVNGVSPGFSLASPHSYAATHKSGAQVAYLNGKQIATDSRVETPAIGPTASEGRLGGLGSVYLVAFWDRILSAGEVASLHANPWQLFAPRQIIIPSAAAGGGYTHPTLSNARMDPVTATGGVPKVTYTF